VAERDRSGNIEFAKNFAIARCNWKGWKQYRQKVYWSIIGYNVRVMTAAVIAATL
jgi:hypothetical protein